MNLKRLFQGWEVNMKILLGRYTNICFLRRDNKLNNTKLTIRKNDVNLLCDVL